MKSPHLAYIAKSPEFAQPILEKIHAAVHKACPNAVDSMKWSSPAFDHEGILATMAAFKAHVNFGLWRGMEIEDPEELIVSVGNTSMGFMRFEKLSDVPSQRVLNCYIKAAMKFNESAAKDRKTRKPGTAKKKAPKAPADLRAALKKKKRALATFEGFSPTNKAEYVEWVTEAKRDATREKRIAAAVEWMGEGKPRNWKYMKEWR